MSESITITGLAKSTGVAMCSAALSGDGDAIEMLIRYYREDISALGLNQTDAAFYITYFLVGVVLGMSQNLDNEKGIEVGSTFQDWATQVSLEETSA